MSSMKLVVTFFAFTCLCANAANLPAGKMQSTLAAFKKQQDFAIASLKLQQAAQITALKNQQASENAKTLQNLESLQKNATDELEKNQQSAALTIESAFEAVTNMTKCAAGQFLNDHGNCTTCLAGSSCTLSVTTPCEPGTFSAPGASVCSKCSPGTAAPALGASQCTPCGAGASSPAGAANCTACAANTYKPSGGAACLPCPVGQTAAPGSSKCALPLPTQDLLAQFDADPANFKMAGAKIDQWYDSRDKTRATAGGASPPPFLTLRSQGYPRFTNGGVTLCEYNSYDGFRSLTQTALSKGKRNGYTIFLAYKPNRYRPGGSLLSMNLGRAVHQRLPGYPPRWRMVTPPKPNNDCEVMMTDNFIGLTGTGSARTIVSANHRDNKPKLFTFRVGADFNGNYRGQVQAFKQGVPVGPMQNYYSGAFTDMAANLVLGRGVQSNARPFSGDLYAAYVYSSALGETERKQVEAFLTDKYMPK